MIGSSVPLAVRWKVQENPIGKSIAISVTNEEASLIYLL